MKVPFLDLAQQYNSIRDDIQAALEDVLASCAFAGGPFVEAFERDFAAFCGCKHAIGVGSGTEALWLSLIALGVGPGDEVITAPNTFIATAESISFCGAKPVFVDVDEKTSTLNPSLLESAVTPRTRVIIPVHLYGQTADMDPVMRFAAAHGLRVVEDACQAHGAEYRGARAGSIGDAGAFSFYPGKNLGAYGEAGAIVTNDEGLATRLRILRDHGQVEKYRHVRIGWNARMDGFQAAILRVKLKHLPRWNQLRLHHANAYHTRLAGTKPAGLPFAAGYGKPVWHLYTIRVQQREKVKEALAQRGVQCGVHYPIPIHLQEAYTSLGLTKGTFPVAEGIAAQTLSLPMFPELSEEQIGYVCDQLQAILE